MKDRLGRVMKTTISLLLVASQLFNAPVFASSSRVQGSIDGTTERRDQMLKEALDKAEQLRSKIQGLRQEIKLTEPDARTGLRSVKTGSLYGLGISAAIFLASGAAAVISIRMLRGEVLNKGMVISLAINGLSSIAFLSNLMAYGTSSTGVALLTSDEILIAEKHLEIAELELQEIEDQIKSLSR